MVEANSHEGEVIGQVRFPEMDHRLERMKIANLFFKYQRQGIEITLDGFVQGIDYNNCPPCGGGVLYPGLRRLSTAWEIENRVEALIRSGKLQPRPYVKTEQTRVQCLAKDNPVSAQVLDGSKYSLRNKVICAVLLTGATVGLVSILSPYLQ